MATKPASHHWHPGVVYLDQNRMKAAVEAAARAAVARSTDSDDFVFHNTLNADVLEFAPTGTLTAATAQTLPEIAQIFSRQRSKPR